MMMQLESSRSRPDLEFRTIADDLDAVSVKSVIMAMQIETLAFEIPPMMRLNKKMMKTLEADHAKYDNKVPN